MNRSVGPAAARAVSRSERFIAAASSLLQETGELDFTVAEVVERSGLSLRSFYQHFPSKDDLLLALFEEAIRTFVDVLRAEVDAASDPVEKLRIYVTGFATGLERSVSSSAGSARAASAALSRFLLTVTSAEPAELARVLEPQVSLLAEIVEGGVDAGRFRRDVSPAVLTALITSTIKSVVEMDVLETHLVGERITSGDLFAFCSAAALADGQPPVTAPGRRRLRVRG